MVVIDIAGDEGACADFQTTGSDTGCAMYMSNCTDAAIQPGAAYDTFACYGYEGEQPHYSCQHSCQAIFSTGLCSPGCNSRAHLQSILAELHACRTGTAAYLLLRLKPPQF